MNRTGLPEALPPQAAGPIALQRAPDLLIPAALGLEDGLGNEEKVANDFSLAPEA